MGGAYRVPGNTAPTTEWNIHCDPEAAKIAFGASVADAGPSRSASTSPRRRRSLPDHVVALARRAGSTPDDSIALSRGEDPMQANRSVAATRSSGSSPTRSASTWSSTRATTASTARSSTTRWPWRRRSTRASSGRRRSPSTSSWAGRSRPARPSPTGAASGAAQPNLDVAVEADADEFLRRFVERVGGLAARLATAQT